MLTKHFLIVFVILVLGSQLGAQAPGRFELGVYSGLETNIVSSPNADVNSSYQSVPAFNIGFSLQHHFSNLFSIVGGVDYAFVQFKFIPPINSDLNNPVFWDGARGLKYDMVRVPVFIQMNFGQKRSKFFFKAGPNIIFSLNDYNRSYTYTFGLVPDVVNYVNVGTAAGAGYSYSPTSWLKFYTEASLMVPLIATPHNGYYGVSSVRVITAGLKIGVSFRLHRPKFVALNN